MELLESVGSVCVTVLIAIVLGSLVGTLITQPMTFLQDKVRQRSMLVLAGVVAVPTFIWLVGSDTDAIIASDEGSKVADTVWGVTIALGASALLFISFNMMFNQVTKSLARFSALLGATIGFVVFGLLDGNRLIQWVGPRDSLANNAHSWVNHGPWTLLIFSLIIAGGVGALAGIIVGTFRERVQSTLLVFIPISLFLGFIWGLFYAERIPVDTTITLLWTPLVGAIVVGVVGYVLSQLDQPSRLIAGTAAGAGIGLMIGGLLKTVYLPRISIIPLLTWGIGLAIVGAVLSRLRKRPPIGGALLGGAIGWLIGAFVATKVGGPRFEAMINTAIPLALVGARFSVRDHPGIVEKAKIDLKSRAWIFLMPAMSFITLGLTVPLIRTIYLSMLRTGRDPETKQRVTEFVLLDNYKDIFTNPNSFNVGNWRNIFTSAPFEIGSSLIMMGLVAAFLLGRRSGNGFRGSSIILPITSLVLLAGAFYEFRLLRGSTSVDEAALAQDVAAAAGAPSWRYLYLFAFLVGGLALLVLTFSGGRVAGQDGLNLDLGGGHLGAIIFGTFLVGMAMFASLRGTLLNSLWWVFAVTTISTSMGLAIAALADRAKFENLAKSIIFMPMAISFVGAGIIWRFMFIARPDGDTQTGVMNYVWLKLADFSQGDGVGRLLTIIILVGLLASLVWLAFSSYQHDAGSLAYGSIVVAFFVGWLLWRLLDHRLGGTGVQVTEQILEGRTIQFLSQGLPYNNLWLMVVLIWIQTGFAMVIFSAAIKAVPTEFLEAASVDGANESSIFWRIVVPQIVPTIGVVVTTLIVTVLKVFDIVKVMTNGNFGSQVIANEMWFQAFTAGNQGLGSALAVVLFISVVPVVYFNVKRIQEGA